MKQYRNRLARKKKKLFALVRKLKKIKKGFFNRKSYIHYTKYRAINEKIILLESQHGRSLGGNIMALARELAQNPAYKEYQLYLSCGKKDIETRRALLDSHGMSRVQLLAYAGRKYYRVLATAHYLINDNTFTSLFFKRPGQIYLNTWHGTPLKTLGKQMNTDYGMIGNAQRNFFAADYLLCPNEFTLERLTEDYMLNNFGTTKLWLTGYPRNSVFLDEKRREEIRTECGFEGKQIIAYLPTWRGIVGNVSSAEQNERLLGYFREWETCLKEHQTVYVKLHPISRAAIDLSQFHKILPFPEQYETYEFLNATDALVTDYSSVFFDYAVSRRKIVLFTYDKEEYTTDRGFYFPMEELPFPQVDTVEALVKALDAPKDYDDTAFLQRFCSHEDKSISEVVLKKLLLGEDSPLIEERELSDNGKKNVFIYAGGFAKNGVTTSILGLLSNLDTTKYNYNIVYKTGELRKRQEMLHRLPEGVSYMGFVHARGMTLSETVRYLLWKDFQLYPYRRAARILSAMAERENLRVFSGCRVDKVIQFSGYSHEWTAMLEQLPCSNTIYVHNDMEQEIETRGNADINVLSRAYQTYDSVAVVTPDLIPVTKRIAAHLKGEGLSGTANIKVVKNVIDYRGILERSREELLLDEQTTMNVSEETLREILSSGKKKFITIGRFSPEKGHFRLISAFEEFHREYPDTCLILIGGHGELFAQTVQMAAESSCPEDIVIIRFMSNPYTVLKQCDYFVLSSFYEGFGLVLAEADILGLPCFSTDITGPKLFMEQYGGKLVENSEEGILNGLRDCMTGNIPQRLNIDYQKYNEEAVAQFESLLP
ncbi:MAG: CDP-glycerol glycerophosphotransferase family protein [Lachnospiraceae bacterium]